MGIELNGGLERSPLDIKNNFEAFKDNLITPAEVKEFWSEFGEHFEFKDFSQYSENQLMEEKFRPDDTLQIGDRLYSTNENGDIVESMGVDEADLIIKQKQADERAAEYNEKNKPVENAIKKGYDDVIPTKNGGVSFENSRHLYKKDDGTKGIVRIEATGNRSKDFDLANMTFGIEETPEGYVWHHLDDYDVKTNTVTLQLVKDEAHNAAKSHSGGCAQYDAVHGPTYNPKRKEQ